MVSAKRTVTEVAATNNACNTHKEHNLTLHVCNRWVAEQAELAPVDMLADMANLDMVNPVTDTQVADTPVELALIPIKIVVVSDKWVSPAVTAPATVTKVVTGTDTVMDIPTILLKV